jgi:hypothetical protein
LVERPKDPLLEYWRARAEALEDEIDLLRELVWRVSGDLPPARVVTTLEGVSSSARVLPAGVEAAAPVASDVKTELERVWHSLLTPWREQ